MTITSQSSSLPLIRVSDYWTLDDRAKALLLFEYLEGGKPQGQAHLTSTYLDGQVHHWVKTFLKSLIPPGVTITQIADAVGVHKGNLVRAIKYGWITLPVLVQVLRYLKFQPRHLPDFPPQAQMMLAGMSESVARSRTLLRAWSTPQSRVADYAEDPLSLADTALLVSLLGSKRDTELWISLALLHLGDLQQALLSQEFTALLDSVLKTTATLVIADDGAALQVAHWSLPNHREEFAVHLVTLWNEYQLAWEFSYEAVSDLHLLVNS